MMAMEGDEEMGPVVDISGEFKAPSEYRFLMMKNRGIFSMDERDKIEGFRFQFALPVAQNFIVQNRWSLVPPQQHSLNPMEMRQTGRPVPTSNYELDLYYIYGADVARQEELDHNKLIHFRGGLKQGGNVDAAIIKRFGNNAELRLEGMFTPRGSQYNLAFELKSRPGIYHRQAVHQHLLDRKHGGELFHQPPDRKEAAVRRQPAVLGRSPSDA
jgi:hypothetical protein